MHNLGVCGLIFDHNTLKECISLDPGKLYPEVMRKMHPRPILPFIKAVERKERGHNGPACKSPTCIGFLRARSHNILHSILFYCIKNLSEETTADQKTQYDSDLKRTGEETVEFFSPPFPDEIAKDV
jgi:hypothetical protein